MWERITDHESAKKYRRERVWKSQSLYRKRVLIEIRKFKDNYDKDGKSRYFDCNIYIHIAKDCRKPKK